MRGEAVRAAAYVEVGCRMRRRNFDVDTVCMI